jgi:hypothetical protein
MALSYNRALQANASFSFFPPFLFVGRPQSGYTTVTDYCVVRKGSCIEGSSNLAGHTSPLRQRPPPSHVLRRKSVLCTSQ